ncbi:hypothetical protein ACFL2X_03300 [Candidatus Latescibacterota bacterium]
MIKPLRILGWFLQFAGAAIVIFAISNYSNLDNVFGGYRARTFLALCLIGGAMFAYGRQVYLPEVKLFKTCLFCAKEIRIADTVCPYCKQDVQGSSRFPKDWEPRYPR